MKTFIPPHDYESLVNELQGKRPALSHVDRIISDSTKVLTPNGAVIAVYLRERINIQLREAAYKVLKGIARDRIDNRPAAVGATSLPRISKDGRLTNRCAVPEGVLKVLDKRGVRQATLRVGTHRRELKKTAALLERLSHLFEKYIPDIYEAQRKVAKKSPDRIPRTPFTAFYLNKNLASAYHRDASNLARSLSTITVIGGDYRGGELCFPRYRIAFALRPGDVLLFLGQELLHGNLRIKGTRLSVICYCERFEVGCKA